MQMYKEAIEEDDTNKMHVEVEEGWKLLLRRGGDTQRYCDALLKDKCTYLVEDAIAEFGLRTGSAGMHSRAMCRVFCTGDYMRMTGMILTIPRRM